MNGFANVTSPTVAAPDPTKHVKYNLGMILGVDDFDQEFAYLSGRDQWLARDLIGYGTVCGLQVTTDTDARGPRVVISPGTAVNPRGQRIQVTPAQCAYLNDWLNEHKDDLMRRIGSPVGSSVALYVTLCYRDCPTDQVPIAGEPCRTESEATVASRLSDDFKLEFGFNSPDQTEEDALRDFVAWLSQIEISDSVVTSLSLEDFVQAIRDAAHTLESPPDFMYGSPPSGIQINTADACNYLRAAYRVWVTELRARWRKNNCDAPDESCVLLAELDVPLTSGWQVDDTRSVAIIEERRPYLIHLRMVQEWLLCARREPAASGAGAGTPANTVVSEMAFGQAANAGTVTTYSRGDHTHGTPPTPVVPSPGSTVVSETTFGQVASAGDSLNYSRENHTHGTPPTPAVPMPGAAVVPETAFGLLPNTGASADYSRADHTHGTPAVPAIPTPANTIANEITFGQAPVAGTSANYSREDHTHGTPKLPSIPVAGNFVTPETTFGQALSFGTRTDFSRADHTHGTPPAPVAVGNFVQHPPGLPGYAIVAAGIAKADGSSPSSGRAPAYNKLAAQVIASGKVRVTFNGYNQPNDKFQYIVKALVVFNQNVADSLKLKQPVVSFDSFEKEGLVLFVTDLGAPIAVNSLRNLEFMIEVSQYVG